MTEKFIRYRKRKYKYQLVEDYTIKVNIFGFEVRTDMYYLTGDGTLVIKSGYAWDGPSGPTIDTPDTLRASLVHDCLYQMIRDGQLPPYCKDIADREFYYILLEDGVDKFRANIWYDGVHLFGDSSCEVGSGDHEIKTAPPLEFPPL
jgi:hypothetical protein